MPRMNGIDATRIIRGNPDCANSKTPIVALTANAMNADREDCLSSGMNDFITKPFRKKQLQMILDKYNAGKYKALKSEKLRFLIVDDDKNIRELLERILKTEFPRCAVWTASNGVQACMLLGSCAPNIIIVDIVMEYVDGVAVIRYLNNDNRFGNIPIIVISALPPESDDSFTDLKINAYLQKPFHPGEVVKAVKNCIS